MLKEIYCERNKTHYVYGEENIYYENTPITYIHIKPRFSLKQRIIRFFKCL